MLFKCNQILNKKNIGFFLPTKKEYLPLLISVIYLLNIDFLDLTLASNAALPQGYEIAHGNLKIEHLTDNYLRIHQTTTAGQMPNDARAIVNWKNFSINENSRVDFYQPSSQAAILNRVTGNTPSNLSGLLNANGQIFLVNPNGITITPTGKIHTGSFVASSLALSDKNFLSGNYLFNGKGASAAIQNNGHIFGNAHNAFVALLGGEINNQGTINVPIGKMALGSGEKIILNLTGDQMLQVSLPTNHLKDKETAFINQSGKMDSQSGHLEIAVASAQDALRQAVNLTGLSEINIGKSNHEPAIVIQSNEGKIQISGQLNTLHSQNKNEGGNLQIIGRDIQTNRAQIDTAGNHGIGTVNMFTSAQDKLLDNKNNIFSANLVAPKINDQHRIYIDSDTSIKARTSNPLSDTIKLVSRGDLNIHGHIDVSGLSHKDDAERMSLPNGNILAVAKHVNLDGLKLKLTLPMKIKEKEDVDQFDSRLAHYGNLKIVSLYPNIERGLADTISSTLKQGNVKIHLSHVNNTNNLDSINNSSHAYLQSQIMWNCSSQLDLSTSKSHFTINAPILVHGPGKLSLNVNQKNSDFKTFIFNSAVLFKAKPYSGQSLYLNNQPHHLIYSENDLIKLNQNHNNVAFAGNISIIESFYKEKMPTQFFEKINMMGNQLIIKR